ncbi:MAG: hypothetical protein LIO60_02655 [Oscillospiraceae bacterium]|nr:hypothetical protein [Oscillospiraceae bacterium]
MSKRKKSSSKHKKSSKCPEPFNTMIDLAAGLTMAAIAGSMEKKHNYSARGKINPYAASAVGMATGRIKNTEDIIRTGALLGAMGSFDDDDTCDDLLLSTENLVHTNDNRYAWRLNCDDGSAYGIFPEDYETRKEYNEALHNEKYGWRDFCEDGSEYDLEPEDFETEEEYEEALAEAREAAANESADIGEVTEDADGIIIEVDGKEYNAGENIVIHVENDAKASDTLPSSIYESTPTTTDTDPFADDDFHVYVYCFVKLPSIDEPIYYRTEDRTLRSGDHVIVPKPGNNEKVTGEIISVEHHMRFSVPVPVEVTRVIVDKAP